MATPEIKQNDAEVQSPRLAGEQGCGKEFEIYTHRFSKDQDRTREITWQVLCKDFFSKYLTPNDVVVDVGAGDGCFIRNIKARRRIAVDLSSHVRELEKENVEVQQVSATDYADALGEPANVIFMSNFLEHLPTKNVLLRVLEHAYQALDSGGRLLILQPNIRYVKAAYWDYIDHHIALTEHSLVEALEISGFEIEKLIPRFLPYTARSTLGTVGSKNTKFLVETYLSLPFVWKLFGQQTFVSAKKR